MLIAPIIRLIAPLIRLIAPLIRWDAGSPASGVQHSARHGASQPKVVHEDDVDEEVAEGIGVLNDTATEFDDGGRVAELADPPERLDEGVGFLDRLLLSLNGGGEGGHEEAFRESLRPSVGARKAAGGVAERERVYQRRKRTPTGFCGRVSSPHRRGPTPGGARGPT